MPVGPAVQYATEEKWNNLEIKIYEGSDGTFTLYEDENDNYNYEKGIYSTITFNWNDKSKTLTIGQRQGTFPGMLPKRKFNIVKISASTEAKKNDHKMVTYTGSKLAVKL